jgi:hypothetical protein
LKRYLSTLTGLMLFGRTGAAVGLVTVRRLGSGQGSGANNARHSAEEYTDNGSYKSGKATYDNLPAIVVINPLMPFRVIANREPHFQVKTLIR